MRTFINFLSNPETRINILKEHKHTIGCLNLILHFLKTSSVIDSYLEDLINLLNIYSNPETCNKYYVFSSIFRIIFEKLTRENNFNYGFEFFFRMAQHFENHKFNNSKAYTVYFAYHLKCYKKIENIMNTVYQEIKIDYKDWKDFYMMNFYKGLIYISLKVILVLKTIRIIQTPPLAF